MARLRWPIKKPLFHSKHCAAMHGLADAETGHGHCGTCGLMGCNNPNHVGNYEHPDE